MKIFPTIVFVYFLCFQDAHSNQGNAVDWDLLIFTQSWPATVCKEWKEKDKKNTCNMPPKENSWTIHGIWPTKLGTIGPEFCNNSWVFSYEQIQPIMMEMRKSWTNIETGTEPYDLWKHEWQKHGTCAAIIEPLNSQFKYFSTGLRLSRKYQIADILQQAKIVPKDDVEYNIIDIYQSIKAIVSHNPVIECRREHGYSYLGEIRLCFDKSLKLIDCDGVVDLDPVLVKGTEVLTNCDTHQGVLYTNNTELAYRPYKVLGKIYKLIILMRWFFSF